jgi:hypothetical protein
MSAFTTTVSRGCRLRCLAAGLVLVIAAGVEAGSFSGAALRGVDRVTVAVVGIPAKFERYGLTAGELRKQTEDRLSAHGIEILSEAAALKDKQAGQIQIKLYTNEDSFAFYSYKISVQFQRKLPLDPDGESFVAETVWSDGRNGVINPSDLKNVYGYVGEILEKFTIEHGRQNVPAHAAR